MGAGAQLEPGSPGEAPPEQLPDGAQQGSGLAAGSSAPALAPPQAELPHALQAPPVHAEVPGKSKEQAEAEARARATTAARRGVAALPAAWVLSELALPEEHALAGLLAELAWEPAVRTRADVAPQCPMLKRGSGTPIN